MTKTDPFSSGVLQAHVHDRLVKNLHAIARRSGLGPAYEDLIWSNPTILSDGEEDFIRKVIVSRRYGEPLATKKVGIAYGHAKSKDLQTVRDTDRDNAQRLREITAKLVRNFVDARLMSPAEMIEEMRGAEGVEASVLLVRDFMLPEEWAAKGQEGFFSKSQREQLDILPRVLTDRAQRGLPTVIQVRSTAQVLAANMPSVFDLVLSSFVTTNDLQVN